MRRHNGTVQHVASLIEETQAGLCLLVVYREETAIDHLGESGRDASLRHSGKAKSAQAPQKTRQTYVAEAQIIWASFRIADQGAGARLHGKGELTPERREVMGLPRRRGQFITQEAVYHYSQRHQNNAEDT